MPSIKQSDLDALYGELESVKDQAEEWCQAARVHEARVTAMRGTLDKIVRAAQGRPLDDGTGAGGYHGSYGTLSTEYVQREPTDAERHERQVQELTDRILDAEKRLSAVVAVATFAKSQR